MAQYNPEHFWEKSHSEVKSSNVKLGIGVQHVGGGESEAQAEALYIMRKVNMRRLLRKCRNIRKPRIFELGSGGGYWARFFRMMEPSLYVGSDLSSSAVSRLRAEFPQAKFVEMNPPALAWQEIAGHGPFDLCLAIDVLYHITDDGLWSDALMRLCQNTHEEGYVIIADYFYTQPCGMPTSTHVNFRELQRYLDILHQNQFAVEYIQPVFYMLNRGNSGPWRDHNRLVSLALRFLQSNYLGLRLLVAVDWVLTLFARPMDPKCKTRLLVARKLSKAAETVG